MLNLDPIDSWFLKPRPGPRRRTVLFLRRDPAYNPYSAMTPELQEANMEVYCNAFGLEIVDSMLMDGTDYESSVRLSEMSENFPFDAEVLLAESITRFTRNLGVLFRLVMRFREKGIVLQSADMPVDLYRAMWELYYPMLGTNTKVHWGPEALEVPNTVGLPGRVPVKKRRTRKKKTEEEY